MMRRAMMRQKRMIAVHTCSVSSFKKQYGFEQSGSLLALAHRNRLIAITLLEVENNQRTLWVRTLCQAREHQGHYNNLI